MRDIFRKMIDDVINRIRRISVFYRLLLGNSIVIILGAIGGTFLTRHLALMGNIKLILLFSFLGISISLIVNYWIIKTALQPLLEGLEMRSSQLSALSERAINAQEEERVRIARCLHDETAQSIASLILQFERIQKSLPPGNSVLESQMGNALQTATTMLEDLRNIIWDLRPSILDDLGLIPAVRWYTRTRLQEAGVNVSFELLNDTIRFPPAVETTLFRITQEAVNNILHHAQATSVKVILLQQNSHICLQIEDDGQGFDVGQTTSEAVSRKQLGLLGIKERASLLGGEAEISSIPGQGTRLCVRIPMLDETPATIEDIGIKTSVD
jgi:two-component system sensor histidine kinase UhpB